MQVELSLTKDISTMAAHADEAERVGFDGVWIGETRIDPMPSLAIAASATQTISLGTGVYIAFARTPMVTAYAARELAKVSSGCFVLGLGSQVKGHIERRFSMPWSPSHSTHGRIRLPPAACHLVQLADGGRPGIHRGLLPPYPDDAVLLASGRWLGTPTGLPGRRGVSDDRTGRRDRRRIPAAPLHHTVLLPRGHCARTPEGPDEMRPRSSVLRIGATLFAVPVAGEPEYLEAREAARQSVAFYASTPPYRRVLDHHGWGDLHLELNALSRRGQWQEMAHAVDDPMLDEFVMIDEPHRLAPLVAQRFGDLIDAVTVGGPHPLPTELHAATVESFHSQDSRRGW